MNPHPSAPNRPLALGAMLAAGAWLVAGALPPAAQAQTQPYAPSEVAKLRAFLAQASMVAGQTNAAVAGADIADPATWSFVGWSQWRPGSDPPELLDYRHVVQIEFKDSCAGAADFSNFEFLENCTIDNYQGTLGQQGDYSNINISGNPRLLSLYLRYLDADAIVIGGNPVLQNVQIVQSSTCSLSLSAPALELLRANTLGGTPPTLGGFPLLKTLDIGGMDNIPTLDLGACPDLEYVLLRGMGGLRSIQFGGLDKLLSVTVSHNPDLPALEVRGFPELASVYCEGNTSLTSLAIGTNPNLQYVQVTDNSHLPGLNLGNLPGLSAVRCYGNTAMTQLAVRGDSVLGFVDCHDNALTALDITGASALKTLVASGNQLTRFDGGAAQFDYLALNFNPFQEITANIAGSPVHALAYAAGGTIGLLAVPDLEAPDKTLISFDDDGLPEPRNTRLSYVQGTGLPGGAQWDEQFELSGAVDATFYFGAVVILKDYFENVEDNPYGEWFGHDQPLWDPLPVVGDPIGPVTPPPRDGYVLVGWYTDEGLTQEWELEHDILMGEMTLYPWWLPEGMPITTSVERLAPADEYTTESCVTFRVVFSEYVSGIDAGDFLVTATGTAAGTVVSVSAGNGMSVDVVVCGITGSGTLGLEVKAAGTGIIDGDGNTLIGGHASGDTYTVGAAGALGAYALDHGLDPGSPAGAATADPDGDGVENQLECVLGGDPAAPDHGVRPTCERITGGPTPMLEFGYTCTDQAAAVFDVSVLYSTNLSQWTTAIAGEAGVTITTAPTAQGQMVTVRIPAPGAQMFAHLRVEPR